MDPEKDDTVTRDRQVCGPGTGIQRAYMDQATGKQLMADNGTGRKGEWGTDKKIIKNDAFTY
jgi:hypothetical protein